MASAIPAEELPQRARGPADRMNREPAFRAEVDADLEQALTEAGLPPVALKDFLRDMRFGGVAGTWSATPKSITPASSPA